MGLALFRLIQEAMTNVARHSRATRVDIRIGARRFEDGRVGLEAVVEDDGRGADLGVPSGGMGLVGMRERVAAFGGTLTSRARPGAASRSGRRCPLPCRPRRTAMVRRVLGRTRVVRAAPARVVLLAAASGIGLADVGLRLDRPLENGFAGRGFDRGARGDGGAHGGGARGDEDFPRGPRSHRPRCMSRAGAGTLTWALRRRSCAGLSRGSRPVSRGEVCVFRLRRPPLPVVEGSWAPNLVRALGRARDWCW